MKTEWTKINRAAVERVLGKSLEWDDTPGETESARTGKPCRMPCARAICPGEHESGNNSDGDLKIFTACHPSQIGVYCWHKSCKQSLAIAVACRRVAMEAAGMPALPARMPKKQAVGDPVEDVAKIKSAEKSAAVEQARIGLELRREIIARVDAKTGLERLQSASPSKVFRFPKPLQITAFFQTLFRGVDPEEWAWVGMPTWSGKHRKASSAFGSIQKLLDALDKYTGTQYFGCFTSPCTFPPDTKNRSNKTAMRRVSFVLEMDKTGKDEQAAILLYLRDVMGLPLFAVIDTGGKSLHGHFRMGEDEIERAKYLLCGAPRRFLPKVQQTHVTDSDFWGGIGGDASMLSISQPCRIPGVSRWDIKDGKEIRRENSEQTLLFLDTKI